MVVIGRHTLQGEVPEMEYVRVDGFEEGFQDKWTSGNSCHQWQSRIYEDRWEEPQNEGYQSLLSPG